MSGLGEEAKKSRDQHLEKKAASDIVNVIREWRGNKRVTARRRWLFELIQNATDTAKRDNKPLKIEIHYTDDSITFRHNAGYFSLGELNAVILGGSTKLYEYEPESKYVGKFGTGFLVTHIASRIVDIRGYAKKKDGQVFSFEMKIDRESDNWKQISDNIEDCYKQLDKAKEYKDNTEELWTEFTYPLKDELEKEAVNEGIEELKSNIPFLFAFNNLLQEIVINGERFIKKSEKIDEENNTTFITVEGNNDVLPTVIKKEKKENMNDEISVAIAIKDNEIVGLEEIPKIYVGMPLTETAEYIKIPFVINSFKFEPTKERDALSYEDKNKSRQNKDLLLKAFKLYKELLDDVSRLEHLRGLFRTVNFKLISKHKTSQNLLWEYFNEEIKRLFSQIVKETPLVETFEGKKEIAKTLFPAYGIIENLQDKSKIEELYTKFYDLVKQIKKNIPKEDEVKDWVKVAKELKKIEGFSELIQLYYEEEMVEELNACIEDSIVFNENYEVIRYPKDFSERFRIEDSKGFLLSLFDIFNELYEEGITPKWFKEQYLLLLLDQLGSIKPLVFDNERQLYIDKIPEELEDLKDILEGVGWNIREELLDKDLAKYKIVQDYVRERMDTDRALDIVIRNKKLKLIKYLRNGEWNESIDGWINLFRWCVKNNKLTDGFPIITKDMRFQEFNSSNEETFIIPFKYMGIDEKYEDIYPEKRIMHEKYFEIEDSDEIISKLKNYRQFVIGLPIYKKTLKLPYNKLESILVEKSSVSKGDHTIEATEKNISTLPFWNEIIGRVSQKQERGKLLFEFVANYLINHDENWKKEVSVNCSCKDGTHKIIPSHWLASLKSDAWVPQKIVENNEEKIVPREATKENIENLFGPEGIKKLIENNQENIINLLTHFGFDKIDLGIAMISINEDKSEAEIREHMSNVVDKIAKHPKRLEILQEINHNPDVLNEILETEEKRKKDREIKKENQKIGWNVEKIIAKIVQDRGLTVRHRYEGADLDIWPGGYEGWDIGRIKMEHYLLEVKFTSGNRVHLSKVQSETARHEKDKYLILVVKNANDLRDRLKEIGEDEDSIPNDIIKRVLENSRVVEGIHTKLGVLPNIEEIEPDIHGYWVKEKLWQGKDNIDKWLVKKFGNGA